MHRSARRIWMTRMLALCAAHPLQVLAQTYAPVRPRPLVFPQDFGAHSDYRTEWWYMTGWLGSGAEAIGFQVTFFRSRILQPNDNPSRFAPRQLMFAHAALALPKEGKLRHAEVSGRVGPAGVSFNTADTALAISGWRLARTADDRYEVVIPTDDFILELEAIAPQGPVLRGEGGYSLKGPSPELASYYYSRPQLKVNARLTLKNGTTPVRSQEHTLKLSGLAWFDHEWSSSLLMQGAVGWDWIGVNLLDGGSLMAFRIRDEAGQTLFSEWDWRDAHGRVINGPQPVIWQPIGRWRSPRSLVTYPESFTMITADREFVLQPLMRDQEVDARASTGGFYYEGAVTLLEKGAVIGRGYLELTGYGGKIAL